MVKFSNPRLLLAFESHSSSVLFPQATSAPHRLVRARRFCKSPPPPEDKMEQILDLLKSRVPFEVDAKTMQERLSKVEAKVYYGGILFGVVAGTALSFPYLSNELKISLGSIKETQERTDKALANIEGRLRVVESQKTSIATIKDGQGTEANMNGRLKVDNSGPQQNIMAYCWVQRTRTCT
ncbi:unnamed protein product [Urochloa humidicola]